MTTDKEYEENYSISNLLSIVEDLNKLEENREVHFHLTLHLSETVFRELIRNEIDRILGIIRLKVDKLEYENSNLHQNLDKANEKLFVLSLPKNERKKLKKVRK